MELDEIGTTRRNKKEEMCLERYWLSWCIVTLECLVLINDYGEMGKREETNKGIAVVPRARDIWLTVALTVAKKLLAYIIAQCSCSSRAHKNSFWRVFSNRYAREWKQGDLV